MISGSARVNLAKKAVFFAALLVVFTLAVLPPKSFLPEIDISDKALHSLTFMFLFFLMDGAYEGILPSVKAGYLMTYGVFIEIVQFFIPYREFSLLDMVANAVGLCLYFLVRQRSVLFHKA